MTSHTASIRMGQDKITQLDRLAASLDRSRSWVINQAIEQYLDHEEWFAEAVGEGVAAADRGDLAAHEDVMDTARERIAKAKKAGR